ncbi:NAD(P)-binding protein [Saccharata proteae CBS 121410]|uniref:NAD(P)-binding protein n=1 Tax=Saccharata proteae CBS 121410 TaxID=1314787 RepID=A0A9P4HS62_9PEZI|nr:NAD(P)-binding protein [Saccharata proteae CBS 121410]
MPYALKGRNVLITGGSRGLGAVIAEKFAEQGCNVAINYASSESAAQELAARIGEKHGVRTCIIKADVGVSAECARCVQETVKAFGGIDILIGNAGYTKFAEFADLSSLPEEDWDKCWAVNVKGKLALLREAVPFFNANKEGGVFLITSSVAGVSQSGSSMAYSVTKAAQLHLMKCMATTQGPKVRVNAVLPGLLLTEWGNKYGDDKIAELKEQSALKTETDLDDCADAYVMLAKNTSITGQKFQVGASRLTVLCLWCCRLTGLDAGLYIAAP